MSPFKKQLRRGGLWLAQTFGTRIIDHETGQSLGRALIVPWKGKVHVIGLTRAVRIFWLPQDRITYWKQEIGFATHPPPDFPNERNAGT
jgi:hypothetical protein